MKQFIIERDFTGSNIVDQAVLRRMVVESNSNLARVAPDAHWILSYFSRSKSFCLVSMSETAISDFLRVTDLANMEVREITATIDNSGVGGLRAVWTAMDSWAV